MNESMITFLDVAKICAPYSIFWALGTLAYNYIVGAMTGKNVGLR